MSIIDILILLIIVGVLLWGVQAIPMDPTIKRVVTVLAIVFVLLWLIHSLTGEGPAFHMGHWR